MLHSQNVFHHHSNTSSVQAAEKQKKERTKALHTLAYIDPAFIKHFFI